MADPLDTAAESAKAAAEIAKTTGKAIDASRAIGCFIARLISGPLEQGVGIFEDKLKYTRWERQTRLMDRANTLLRERGLTEPERAIPLKLAIPLVQAASLEDDDYLQDIWAQLLVNAATNSGVNLQRAFISILESLTPLEAHILECVYRSGYEAEAAQGLGWVTTDLPRSVSRQSSSDAGTLPPLPPEEVVLALADLARLGCIKSSSVWDGGETYAIIHPTVLGEHFVRACSSGQ
jgi:hypothetical protein